MGNWEVLGDRMRYVVRGLRFGKSVRKEMTNSMDTVVVQGR